MLFMKVKNQMQVMMMNKKVIMNNLEYFTTLSVVKSYFQPPFGLWSD